MRRLFILLFLLILNAGMVFSYEYPWERTGSKNIEIDAGSYVKRPEGEFFNVKDEKQQKVYTMQHHTKYSENDKQFYHFLGIAQTCQLEDYIKYGRGACSPLTAKPAESFEKISIDDTDYNKWLLVTVPRARCEYIKNKPDYWINHYYAEDMNNRIKTTFAKKLKKAKKDKTLPKIKAPQKIFVNIAYEIMPDGTLKSAEVTASSGDEFFEDILLNSFKQSAPFLVFPVSADREILKGEFQYEFNLISRRKSETKFLQVFK